MDSSSRFRRGKKEPHTHIYKNTGPLLYAAWSQGALSIFQSQTLVIFYFSPCAPFQGKCNVHISNSAVLWFCSSDLLTHFLCIHSYSCSCVTFCLLRVRRCLWLWCLNQGFGSERQFYASKRLKFSFSTQKFSKCHGHLGCQARSSSPRRILRSDASSF